MVLFTSMADTTEHTTRLWADLDIHQSISDMLRTAAAFDQNFWTRCGVSKDVGKWIMDFVTW